MTRDERWVLEEKYGGIETAAFTQDCARLASGEPVAYVIGWQPFLGLKIYLDSKPLIPRTETEWWTELLLSRTSRTSTFLDLCAGSGAIGCAALAALPETRVYFGEINQSHQATIEKNILENRLDSARASIRIGDLFTPFKELRFDIIAINPPYIPFDRPLEKSVGAFEPKEALFSGQDGLALIRRIAAVLPSHLAPGGTAWIECDSAHAADACALFKKAGMPCEIRTDQYEKPRVLVVSFP